MQKYQESEARRKARLEAAACLRTKIVESKKKYNRKKLKMLLNKDLKETI